MILDEILAHKQAEVARRQARVPLEVLRQRAADAAPPRDFRAAIRRAGRVSLIAEIKRKSPSGGELRPGASAADLANAYARNGAAALSVLTDERFFGGRDDDLVEARDVSGLPVLRKDFVVADYQVYEARALGADAVLLIVRALDQELLARLLELVHSLGFEALVETHSAEEVQHALDADARIVGVNNRDLDRLVTDVTLAPRLRSLVPPEVVFVAESGIHDPRQVAELAAIGCDAVLVGESLVRAADPGARLAELVKAGAAEGQVPA